MKLWTCFLAWRFRHREAAHRRFLRDARVTYTFNSPPDPRDWQGSFNRGRK